MVYLPVSSNNYFKTKLKAIAKCDRLDSADFAIANE